MADPLAVDDRFRSSNKQEVLAAALKLMDELRKEREQGIANERPRYMDISFAHRVRSNNLKAAINNPPLPLHIQHQRMEEARKAWSAINPNQYFDPYRDIPELPMGGRKVSD